MKDLKVRVDQQLYGELQAIASQESETVSTIVRRCVRRGLESLGRPSQASRLHDGTGRVR